MIGQTDYSVNILLDDPLISLVAKGASEILPTPEQSVKNRQMGLHRDSEEDGTEGRRTPDSWVSERSSHDLACPASIHDATPLPYSPIIALCLSRIAEGMMFSVVLPYINEMVHGMGVKEEDVGKWSAAAVSPALTDQYMWMG